MRGKNKNTREIDSSKVPAGTAPHMDGCVVGDYLIERCIGSGSMSHVYLATHRQLGRRCVLKLAKESDKVRTAIYTEVEGRTLSQFDHPGIVKVLDAFVHNERKYLVMEYADGGDLAGYIKKAGGRLEEGDTRAIMAQLLRGLAHAHELGVIHRYIKPGNVLLKGDSRWMLSDFDTSINGYVPTAPVPVDSEATLLLDEAPAAKVAGCFDYMSPEERRGLPADARSDIYALGTMCYRMLCGELPGVMSQVPSAARPGLSKAWDAWIARCLETDPAKRFQSASEALYALTRPNSANNKQRWSLWQIIAAVITVLVMAWIFAPDGESGAKAPAQDTSTVSVEALPDPTEIPDDKHSQPRPPEKQLFVAPTPPAIKPNLVSASLADRLPRSAAMIEGRTGGLVLKSIPDGAKVLIDNTLGARSPVLLGELEPGKHQVIVNADGYREARVSFNVEAGRYTELADVVLERLTGALRIESEPDGLEWEFTTCPPELPRDLRQGRSPALLDGLPTGRYMVEFRQAGWPPLRENVDIPESGATIVGRMSGGSLLVVSRPEGALVLDRTGKELGRTPLHLPSLPAGECELRLRLNGYREARVSGVVVKGKELRLASDLQTSSGPREGENWVLTRLNMDMVWVKPGSFVMGSGAEISERLERETPAHKVILDHGYWMGSREVTLGQWEAIMGTTPNFFGQNDKALPVESVTWDEAMEFCRILSGLEQTNGQLPVGYEYSLPSEAQWEYACRLGWTGQELSEHAWHDANSGGRTHRSGSLSADSIGQYDMLGNVLEWCYDAYAPYTAEAKSNPVREVGTAPLCVLRGGAWNNSPTGCRPAYRYYASAATRSEKVGFRLALVPQRK